MVDFAPLFAPQSVAVIGASSSSGGVANNFLRNLRELGFAGRVYAVHPSRSEIEGWPALPGNRRPAGADRLRLRRRRRFAHARLAARRRRQGAVRAGDLERFRRGRGRRTGGGAGGGVPGGRNPAARPELPRPLLSPAPASRSSAASRWRPARSQCCRKAAGSAPTSCGADRCAACASHRWSRSATPPIWARSICCGRCSTTTRSASSACIWRTSRTAALFFTALRARRRPQAGGHPQGRPHLRRAARLRLAHRRAGQRRPALAGAVPADRGRAGRHAGCVPRRDARLPMPRSAPGAAHAPCRPVRQWRRHQRAGHRRVQPRRLCRAAADRRSAGAAGGDAAAAGLQHRQPDRHARPAPCGRSAARSAAASWPRSAPNPASTPSSCTSTSR